MSPSTRVLLHLAEYSPTTPGAFAGALAALAPEAIIRGWTPHLALPRSDGPRAWHDALAAAGWTIHFLPRPWGPRPAFLGAARALLAAVSPTVAHVHFSAPALPAIAIAGSGRRVLRVMHWHNPPRAARGLMVLSDAVARPQHIAVGIAVRDAVAAQLPHASTRLRVLPNAVPFPDSVPPPTGDDLVTIAAFRAQKDPDTLLAAVASLASGGWTGTLRWIGSGVDLERVREAAAARGLAERVQFLGAVDDPTPHLVGAAAFVLSSLYEGQPYAVLEALAHGRPVAATDLPGVRELLGSEAEEWCAPPGDAIALAERLRSILGDLDSHARRARALRESLRAGHSPQAWTGTLLNWYDEWIG